MSITNGMYCVTNTREELTRVPDQFGNLVSAWFTDSLIGERFVSSLADGKWRLSGLPPSTAVRAIVADIRDKTAFFAINPESIDAFRALDAEEFLFEILGFAYNDGVEAERLGGPMVARNEDSAAHDFLDRIREVLAVCYVSSRAKFAKESKKRKVPVESCVAAAIANMLSTEFDIQPIDSTVNGGVLDMGDFICTVLANLYPDGRPAKSLRDDAANYPASYEMLAATTILNGLTDRWVFEAV